jgi:3-dehydroquinate synthetase
MSRDKKVRDQVLTLVLMRGIGQSFLTSDYDRGALRQMLTDRPTGIATAHR